MPRGAELPRRDGGDPGGRRGRRAEAPRGRRRCCSSLVVVACVAAATAAVAEAQGVDSEPGTWSHALSDDGESLCPVGQCINCAMCNGGCNNCVCDTLVNTCCCKTPVGTFARGFVKLECPGGTFQDEVGQSLCKPCPARNGSQTLYYDLRVGGFESLHECAVGLCSDGCHESHTDCEVSEARCVTPDFVVSQFNQPRRQVDWCRRQFDFGFYDCSWAAKDAAPPRRAGLAAALRATALLSAALLVQFV